MNAQFKENYLRLLGQLKFEIKAYPSDDAMFQVLPGTTNSGGNLAMHLIGNLRHFYGALLVGDGYERKRNHEFQGRSSCKEMLKELDYITPMMANYFDGIKPETAEEKFPVPFFENEVTKGWAYLQLLHHLGYHLGQINYHRRYLESGKE